ncbi:MAG: flagellar hook-basal body complex protein FliE [Planctomycetota bacterium]
MSDPLGLVGGGNAARGPGAMGSGGPGGAGNAPKPGDPDFKNVLLDNLRQVNQLSNDANRAIEDLATGKRDDVEQVILATQQADNAFRMLQSVRNKVVEAYDSLQQVRV